MNTTKLQVPNEMKESNKSTFKAFLTIMMFLATMNGVMLFHLYKGAGDEGKVAGGTLLVLLNLVFIWAWPKERK